MTRTFKGKVPVEDDKISYEITIKFSSEINKITDRFLFTIDKNIWICALENVSSIDKGGIVVGVSMIEMGVKIYALVADWHAGLKIIDVSDP